MDKYEEFKNSIKEAVNEFKGWDASEPIRLISHLDADGISAISILIKALNNFGRRYVVSIIQTLDDKILNELKRENYKYYIFTDLGSGCLSRIREILSDKVIMILDHHEIENTKIDKDIVFVNPHIFDIDGSQEISGSGVVYFFYKYLTGKRDMAHIAIVGAIGDLQENNGFLRLNDEILKDAIEEGKIEVSRGLRFFGAQTKPLHKVLEYCSDPIIPGVSGSESAAISFLQSIGINPKKGLRWRTLNDLTDKEKKMLAAAIIIQRLDEDSPEDVFGNIYTLVDEEEGTPFRDAKEFSTLLNACGRMKKASLGIGACLNNKKAKKKAYDTLLVYKREIMNAIDWYEKNKENFIRGKGYVIINAENNIMSSIVGTLASIVSKSKDVKDNTFILSMAQNEDLTTKVSLRISGKKNGFNLKAIMDEIVEKVGGQAGGHMNAAGAVIKTEKEEEFIRVAKEVLEKKAIEEIVS